MEKETRTEENQTPEEIQSILEESLKNQKNLIVTFKNKNNPTLRKYGMQNFGTLNIIVNRIELGIVFFKDGDGEEGDIVIDDIKKLEILSNE